MPSKTLSSGPPPELVAELYESYQVLAGCCIDLRDAVASERNLPVYVPTVGHSEQERTSEYARAAGARSMTQLFVQKNAVRAYEAGILCASNATVGKAIALNDSKERFKKAVLSIRSFESTFNKASSPISEIVRNELAEKGYRTEQLKQAMNTVGIGSLDLKRCYAQVRVMPPRLDVFSWTWAANHSRIKKVTRDQAIEMTKKLSPEASEVALDLLGRCPADSLFAVKAKLPNQLRANYAYWEDGDIIRKSCPISGVVIAQQANLPRYLWRDDPGENRRRPESASVIEANVFIESLGLYRYVE